MAKSLLDLAKQLDKLVDDIATAPSNGAKTVALAVVEYLAWYTPVDTSNALSNWQVSLNVPITAEIPPYVPGFMGSSAAQSARAAIDAATKALAPKKPGQTIYIANNAPYINDLDNGSSAQAPRGFSEAALLIGRLKAAEIRIEFK